MQIDTTTEFGARVARRLAEDEVVWLTTVGADGMPQPSPVWFFWDGETVLMYSQRDRPKLRNIGRNPRVSLSFNTDARGDDVVILTGEAWIDHEAPPATDIPAFIAKYVGGMAHIGQTAEEFARDYPVAVRVRPAKLRGF